ncbi:hypothetical protein Bca52824_008890 [Brassica carinata]|uniref:Rhamnogalacturonase A/B/Epimerase-like pectate lyase domain-containing protein n=1 Tax=Brassica carinata TaxID=52824 RepID=A0A8X7WB61_BRACI|nr:hypothetical protein Bca52824_008890 [Brassica carinata]
MANNTSFPCAIILVSIVVFLINSSNAMPSFNVQKYGARGDGKTDSTEPFLTAWSLACGSEAQAMVYIPHGTYLVRNLVFSGPCKNIITFKIDGKLVAPKNYWSIGNSGYWILFAKVNRILVYGGTIDAKGAGYWSCRKKGGHCPQGARSISFSWCNNVLLSGLTIGSLGDHADEEGVKNVTVTNSVFTKTRNGVRIKSWARPSSGFVRNVEFRNLVMRNVGNPLIIDQNYCPSGKGCPNQLWCEDKWSDICKHKGTSRTPIAVKLDCSGSHHCTGIRLKNINLTYMKGSTTSFCKNAHGRASRVVVPMNCSSKFECDEAFGQN